MRFRVLGPLQVWDGAAWSPVRAAQQRVVLAVLLASAGHVVATERLVDELWGQRPPPSAVVTVQGYVRRLRRLLGGDAYGVLVTRGAGYELTIGDGDLDAAVFEGLVAAGKRAMAAGRVTAAAAAFSEGLELWRGRAFTDVPASAAVVAEAARLEQARLGAIEERMGAELELGRHAAVVDELWRLAVEHPTRERLWAQLMVGLYRCGRRDDALTVYRDAGRVLADTLGLEPGPELRELRRRVLAGDPALAAPAPEARTRVAPARLPADVAGFTGRRARLKRLDALVPEADSPVLAISTIAGAAGVGKTALAVRWAHRVKDHFPDGQLYVNLRGYAAGPPLRPIDALAVFLADLGVPAEEIPTEEEHAAALFRSLLADTRTLVVLDNANSPEQVRPLLPGGAGCLVLVTSRDRLRGLVAMDGAVRIELDALAPDEAKALLTHLLGAGRAAAEPSAVAELAQLCGYLPLALRMAAANLAANAERPIAEYTDRLRTGDRLAALRVSELASESMSQSGPRAASPSLRGDGGREDPHGAVRVAFDHSYTALPAQTRSLFRLLGLVPGPDVTDRAAAALAGIPSRQAAHQLDRLANTYLVDEHEPGRYALHDLIRRYAADRAADDDSAPTRESALSRLFDHYLHTVDAAARLLYPHILRVPPPTVDTSAGFEDSAQALEWLDAERANLVAAVHHASTHGPQSAGWRLADALRGYFYLRRHTVDWQLVAPLGLAAAEKDGNLRGRAASHLNLATMNLIHDRHQQAIEDYGPALALSRQAGWAECESAVLGGLGNVHAALGRPEQAAEYFTEALAIDRRMGWFDGQATKISNLGIIYWEQGRLELAAEHLAQALALARRTGSRMGQARCLTNLGRTYGALGRFNDALGSLTGAVALHREVGDRNGEAETLRLSATVHRDAGRPTEALGLAGTALELSRENGDRHVQAQALATAASVHLHLGEHGQAVAGHRQAVDLARDIGNRQVEAEALIGLATASWHAGDPGRATDCAKAALTIATTAGYRMREGQALAALAAVHLRTGDRARALDLAEQALANHAETGHRLGEANAHLIAEHALHGIGRSAEAQTHHDRADTLLTEIGAPMAEHARVLLGGQPPA